MNQLQIIHEKLHHPSVIESIKLSLGADKAKALSYAHSVYAEIKKTSTDPKKDLTGCDPQSLVQCMRDAAQLGLGIDGRQHAHLIKYGNTATLQVGYRGILAKIKEAHPDADIVAKPIYEGDVLDVYTKDSQPTFDLKQANPFASGKEGMIGVLVACTYTDNGRLVRMIETVPMERINRAKNTAKQQFIWNSDFVEKAKVAAIKNAFKIMFAEIQGLQKVITYDNEQHHELKDVTPKSDDGLKDELMAIKNGGEQYA